MKRRPSFDEKAWPIVIVNFGVGSLCCTCVSAELIVEGLARLPVHGRENF